jgi:hypothetical protein
VNLSRAIEILVRLFSGGILCFFAFIPAWIEYHAITDAIATPGTIDTTWFIAIIVCSALLYFLLLLAYRAFAGRGRKQDGGLLPPFAMQGFAALFGLLGAAVSTFGLYQRNFATVFWGLLEFLAAASVFRMIGQRRKARSAQQ